jgi:hypothetical protein
MFQFSLNPLILQRKKIKGQLHYKQYVANLILLSMEQNLCLQSIFSEPLCRTSPQEHSKAFHSLHGFEKNQAAKKRTYFIVKPVKHKPVSTGFKFPISLSLS